MKKLELIVVLMKENETLTKRYLIENVCAKWDLKNTLLAVFKEHDIDLVDDVDGVIESLQKDFTYSYYGWADDSLNVQQATFIVNHIRSVDE